MPRLAANLSMMFTEVDFPDRFAAAASAGFTGVEYLFPYARPADVIADCLASNDLVQVLFNIPAGDWDAGERGIACLPDRVGEFRDGVGRALDYARATGCRLLHAMSGVAPDGSHPDRLTATFVDNIRFAAEAAAGQSIDITLEPINSKVDLPGYFLDSTAQALAVIEAVDRPNVRLQYDIYHMQIMEGDLARTIETLLPKIGHMQLADNPGRHEPGTGEINFPWLLGRIDALGYAGWIGCEYQPAAATEAGLDWARPYLN